MSHRKMTPKGQMSSSGSGPAIMMMPPHIRATFMPNPPLKHLPPIKSKRKKPVTGLSKYMVQFERTAPTRVEKLTPRDLKKKRLAEKKTKNEQELKPLVEEYRSKQQNNGGEHEGMNCYNTLFVGRLAYEVTERKLLREFEVFGPVKDLKLIKKDGKPRGYAFIEYENEEDMKRAYRAADGMKLEGKATVVDVERGHTVPTWLPRRLGGGLGGTRLGSKGKNVTRPGRYDPSRPDIAPPPPMGGMGMGRGRGGGGGGPPPPGYHRDGPYGGGPPPYHRGPPPPRYDRGPPPRGGRDWDRGGRGGYDRDRRDSYNDRKRRRSRSRSPERRHSHGRRRY